MTPAGNNMGATRGALAWIERTGNRLPDPVFIFVWLIAAMVIISAICALAGVSAPHPTRSVDGVPEVISAISLLSAENIRRLLLEMPTTFAHFPPLGYVIVVMLGAGVAERSGLFATAMTVAVRRAPTFLLTPAVALLAMLGNLAADAGYVVLIPLAGIVFAAAGRHPIAGIATAFAGVSGGFSANLIAGPLDALLLSFTEAAAHTLDPDWTFTILGNWYFIVAMTIVYLPVIWYVTDRIIEPRLQPFEGPAMSATAGTMKGEGEILTDAERRGLRRAGLAVLAVVGLWLLLCIGPGTPLVNQDAEGVARLQPLFTSLVAGFFVMFLACGWAYGSGAGTIKSHRDVVQMMTGAMSDLAYYLVLAFAAAHFVAMFNWSNLGLIVAIKGASLIQSTQLPMAIVLGLIVLFSGSVNLLIGSASAKWGLMAPVLVPMLMLLGVSPEMTTAAYRVGDSVTNIITPLMPYFPLILVFCQRWQKSFGLGSLAATMIPYSMWMLGTGLLLTMAWVLFGLPLGPGAPVSYVSGY